jgi:ATP-dependent DNA helicase PIF1
VTDRGPGLEPGSDLPDVELNDDFRAALGLIEQTSQSLFVTGRAGTGKSTLLRHFRATTTKPLVVLAPTGLAAINVGGQTIHSFFGFPPRLIDPQSLRPGRAAGLLHRLETLVVDEVSMVRADVMDGIDRSLRLGRGRRDTPFGGVQVVLIGDLCQLPPIVRERELGEYFAGRYGGPYFFQAPVFRETRLPVVELEKVYRQTDARFLDLLNGVRERRLDPGILESLNARVRAFERLDELDDYVTLTPTNEAALRINLAFLADLPGPEQRLEAVVAGRFDRSAYPTDSRLRLKAGARIMMLRNDFEGRWVNGSMGVVSEVGPASLRVAIDGLSHEVAPHTWENVEYVFSRRENRIDQQVVGTFQQYPLKLAWALTIHKSQGQTFDRVHLDLGRGAFAHGQTYVALSRCRSLDGLALSRPISPRDVLLDETIHEYRDLFAAVPPPAG